MPTAIQTAFAAALLMLMQAGFALVTCGLCRAKNAGQIITGNLMIMVSSLLGFWVCGFFVMFDASVGGAPDRFLVMSLIVSIAAVIPAGAMAERWSFRSMVLTGFWMGALPIALFGRWVWGGGWLARLGQSWGLGHGVVDFAGSSVVHMSAGVIALVGSSILDARVGKYARDGRPKPMPGHNLVFVTIGTLILFAGWFGFNSTPSMSGGNIVIIFVNTLLAGAAGAFAAYGTTVFKFGKPDTSMICNGLLGGLVAISASCAFVNSVAAVIIGGIAGCLVVLCVLLFEGTLKIDDPVGAISVHGVSGAWGMLGVGLFANGSFGAGWNGIQPATDTGVSGAFGKLFGGSVNDWSQLGAQCIGVLVCLICAGLLGVIWFKISNLITPLRTRRDFEIGGLDLPETGAECYPDFHLTDKGSTQG